MPDDRNTTSLAIRSTGNPVPGPFSGQTCHLFQFSAIRRPCIVTLVDAGLYSNRVDTMLLWMELLVLLSSIVVGARRGGIALGPMGGLFVFVFLFGLAPGSTPGTVLGMILAVITALSLMQAAGGLDYVIQLAEKVLRRNPRRITFLAPLVTCLMILASGTQHVIYPEPPEGASANPTCPFEVSRPGRRPEALSGVLSLGAETRN